MRILLPESAIRPPQAAPLEPSVRTNRVTAASALPVLHALLPGSDPLRWSTPSSAGLPGGYPVRIEGGAVKIDVVFQSQ